MDWKFVVSRKDLLKLKVHSVIFALVYARYVESIPQKSILQLQGLSLVTTRPPL